MNNLEIEKTHFAVFVIDALAKDWHKNSSDVYKTLRNTGLMDEYIIEFYDVLHTQGEQAIVYDINEKLRALKIENRVS